MSDWTGVYPEEGPAIPPLSAYRARIPSQQALDNLVHEIGLEGSRLTLSEPNENKILVKTLLSG
jgi:hypothetical protein